LSPLALRVASALIMAPVALAAVWLGPPSLSALVLVVAGGMGWEWARLCLRGGFGPIGALIVATDVFAVAVLVFGAGPVMAGAVAFAGSAGVMALSAATRAAEPSWAAAGTLWVALGAASFLSLAIDSGRGAALWLLAVVWATDIGAYAAGRSIGGVRLAPRLSPNKTWAGLVGGIVSAALVGLVAAWLGRAPLRFFVPVSMALAVIAQLGDLAESLAKRHFGVKDSGGLIPGHGGLLDRLDGLLAASLAAWLISLTIGQDPLGQWR
jgi:phosphatidate cytidylyltransferase